MDKELTPGLIHSFKEHVVWQTILARLKVEYESCLHKAVDESDARSAGKYRAYKTVFDMPDLLLKELEGGEGVIKKIFRGR